jgi:hypothetical protein
MLSKLQDWVAGYYQRDDAWSYRVHRAIFDAFTGPKVEHRELAVQHNPLPKQICQT